MKKIISTILIVMLISVQLIPILNVKAEGSTITTYGENEEGIRSDLVTNTANLSVENISNEDEFSVYKIIDVFYNSYTNEITYDFTSQFRTFLEQTENYGQTFTIDRYFELTSDQVNEYCPSCTSVITTSTLNVLVSKYTTYIRENNINRDYDLVTHDSGAWDDYATAEVVAGAYLILPTNVNTNYNLDDNESLGNRLEIRRNIYGVMVANVVFSASEGKWLLNDKSIYAKNGSSYLNTMLFNVSTKQYTDYLSGIDVGVSPNYQVDINSYKNKKSGYALGLTRGDLNFPTNAINKEAVYTIQFPEGIDFDSENIYAINDFGYPLTKINDGKIISEGRSVGTVSIADKKINVVLEPESYVIIVVDVWLNDKAVIGDVGNEINTTLTITDDPYVEGSIIDLDIKNTIYTYGLEITNLSKEDSVLLKGAKYEIYSKYTDSVLSNKIGEFTVGDDGKTSFAGVPSGTIYLKQVKAPTGYQIIKEPIAVEIATEEAELGTEEGYYQVITYNDAMWYLPSTGGVGTIIYTLIGLLVIGLSTFSIIYLRKRQIKLLGAK